ncbi:hypothetical protein CEP53_007043 [Fusarium sp. AF-6]|nr:hypothetical protein CEP53_007043 [Fusarium sp. AF-6]
MADPLSMAASIVGLISLADTLFRHTYKFGRTATGAKKEIQDLAAEINSFSGLLRNLEALADELEADGQAFEPTLKVDHLIECRKIFENIERKVTKALDSFNNRSRWEGVSRSLKWPFSASDTRELLQQLSRCKGSITLATSADTMRSLQQCLMKQKETGDTLAKIVSTLEKVEIRTSILMDPRKQLVLDFFMAPELNPQANLDQSLKLRQPTTGEWFTHSFAFTEWLQTPGSRLWPNGAAGGGKTVLAGAMIQEAIVRKEAEPDVAVAFFFCDYKQEATLKPVNIIGALASQLAIQRDESFNLLEQYYEELHPARGLNKPADTDELVRIMEKICNIFSQVIIIIDGLDECADGVYEVVEALCDLSDLTTTTSMALISRDEVEIRQAVEGTFKEIVVEAREEDLKIYVRAEIERRMRAKQLDIQNKTIRDEIQNELVNRANGMFRWVVCQLDYLGQLVTDADRRQALHELPPTLSETYLRLLQRINKRPPRVRKLVQKCLHFIACYPYMSINLLCVAVSVPETIGTRMDETNTISEREIALCCSSLIRRSNKEGGAQWFEFAHFSVKEFLQDEVLLSTPELGAYRLVESEGQTLIALQFLRFLQVGNINNIVVETQGPVWTESEQLRTFYSMASIAWLKHTQDGLDHPLLYDAAKSLFNRSATPGFRLWTYILFKNIFLVRLKMDTDVDSWIHVEQKIRDMAFSDSLPPLHIASALNLPEICSFLIQSGAQVDAKSPLGTPLLLAEVSFLGFIEDVSDEYPDRDTPYFATMLSSSTRRDKTIDCLSSAGASFSHLDGPVGNHSMLLTVAIIGCHGKNFTPFITLLDHGHVPTDVDIIAFGDYLKTWSNCEDCSGLEKPILKLLDYLMRSSAYDSDWGFNLGEKIWLAAVTLGFDFTNDTSLTDSRISLSVAALVDKTLLAIENDDTTTLRLCLKDGRVSINQILQQGEFVRTLLHHAVAVDVLECSRLLLELGVDTELSANTGTPTLHCCNMKGDGSVLKLLVEHGLSLLVKDPDEWTIWHACAAYDSCEISFIETLFNIDPESNQEALLMETDDGSTPTMMALEALEDASKDDFQQLESKALLFLHYGQKIPNFWDHHESLFMLASWAGSKKVFQSLLGMNPGSGIISGSGIMKPGDMTPLHCLGVSPTKEWLEFLTKTYPEALQLRSEDQLPLESYIERALRASEAPQSDVVQALSSPDMFRLKNRKGFTPWKVVCDLKDKAEHWANKERFLNVGWLDLDRTWVQLLDLKAMEAYESETGQCGVYPLLTSSWANRGYWVVSPPALEKSIQSSNLWDPNQDVVVSYLKSAVLGMDIHVVNILTEHGTDIHRRENGTSAFEFACEAENARQLCSEQDGLAVLQHLLDHSRPERIRDFSADHRAFSLLHRLAMVSPPERIEWLLRKLVEKGADVDAISPTAAHEYRMSPLTWHLVQNSIRCAEVLLELGADPLLTGDDVRGASDAFIAAVTIGSVPFLEKLHSLSVKKSIDTGWKQHVDGIIGPKLGKIHDHDYFTNGTLCHWACSQKHFDVVEFLLQNGLVEDINSTCEGGFTPLHFAAMSNQANIIELLISHKASVNLQSDKGQTALHLAAHFENLDAMNMLIQLGALTLVDKDEWLTRMLALEGDNAEAMDILISQITYEGNNLAQKLGLAIEKGDLDECRELVAAGCPIDEPLHELHPTYPLLFAMHDDEIEIAQWILDNGASVLINDGDIYPVNKSSSVVEEAAKHSNYLPIIPTILARYDEEGGCWVHGSELPLHYATGANHAEGLRLMLNHLTEHAVTIGHRSNARPEEVVSLVVNRISGLRVSSSDLHGRTTLHIAVSEGHFACAELLLENGADPDQLTTNGEYPLDFATDPEMTALLLRHGASPAPILQSSFISLLGAWGANHDKLIKIYQGYMQDLGIGLKDVLDSSSPRFHHEFPYAIHSPPTYETLKAIASQGHVFNYILWTLPELSSFLLNSELALETLQPFSWHWYIEFSSARFLDKSFKKFRRRFGDRAVTKWLNPQPDKGWSPLCRAATTGSIEVMENCLEMGAEIDFEGCPLGSALMIASACGRLEAVQLLVRRGAAVNYNGRIGPINVLSVARSWKVKSWLLESKGPALMLSYAHQGVLKVV